MPSYTLIRHDGEHKEDFSTGNIDELIEKVGEFAERDKVEDLPEEEVEKEVEAVVEAEEGAGEVEEETEE